MMDGFLNINKAAGWTSHDVVAKIRSLLARHLSPEGRIRPKQIKVGHAGTLDPQATGVLPICLGKATKLAEFLLHTDKKYHVVMKLGEVTDTQDATGRVLSRTDVPPLSREVLERVLQTFVGPVQQVPPMFSAIKVKGQPLYKMARKGQVVERAPREIVIHSLKLLELRGTEVTFEADCSKGTYIRTLCADLGSRLEVGGYCLQLQRRQCGPFRIEDAVTVEQFQTALDSGQYKEMLQDPSVVLGHLPELAVEWQTAEKVLHGMALYPRDVNLSKLSFKKGDMFRLTTPRLGLIALVRAEAAGETRQGPLFKIEKVLVDTEKLNHSNGLRVQGV